MTVKKYESQNLKKLGSLILEQQGVSSEHAETVAQSLITADLRGVSSHGILRLPVYVKRLENGKIKANPDIKKVVETDSTIVIDGDHGLGHVVAQEAIQELIAKSEKSKISAVAIRRSNHYGAAAYWAMQLAEHNMIGLSVSNVEPLMPPPGGTEARVGNNPISFAAPAGESPAIVLDMATSVVPLGKILNAKSKNESIPEGWALNAKGNPTTDPDEVVNGGFLFPVGGPKGYGLSVIVDLLSALLSNGAIGDQIHSMYQDLDKPNDISHFFLGIKIDGFMQVEQFKGLVDQYIAYIKNTPLVEGANEIYLPGEIEHRNLERNKVEGIGIPDSVISELVELATKAGINQELITQLTSPLEVVAN